MSEPTLLPCPFCGQIPDDVCATYGGDEFVAVLCENCRATGPILSSGCTPEELAAAWNRRAPQPKEQE